MWAVNYDKQLRCEQLIIKYQLDVLNSYELTHSYSGSVSGLSAYLGLQSQLPIPSYANQRFTSIQNIL